MINQNTLDLLEQHGFGADIDAFESYVMRLQDAAGNGNPEVTDAQYDDYIRLLKDLKPESEALTRNWETEDNELGQLDLYLDRYGMKSIRTIQTISDLNYFVDLMGDRSFTMFASSKINGHGVRAVYANGVLVSASTRGRYKKGRDITRHLKLILPDNIEQLKDVPLAEIRGELYVSFRVFESIKHMVKTPLSAVTSLSRDSANDEDIQLMNFCAYQILTDDLVFESLSQKFKFLMDCGFEIPFNASVGGINKNNFHEFVDKVLEYFGNKVDGDGLAYDSDGIVVAIDNVEDFNNMGNEGNYMLGNFALKMGRWESNIYSSTIESIEWCYGKRYITPKAHVAGVITRNGSEVRTVPLYNVGVMQENNYYPGKEVFFKYGGETGVTLVRPDGTPING